MPVRRLATILIQMWCGLCCESQERDLTADLEKVHRRASGMHRKWSEEVSRAIYEDYYSTVLLVFEGGRWFLPAQRRECV